MGRKKIVVTHKKKEKVKVKIKLTTAFKKIKEKANIKRKS